MRLLPLWVCVLLLLPVSAIPQEARRAVPPGVIQAEKVSNRPLEPPLEMRNRQVVVQVKQEADELRRLADGVSLQIEQVTNGQLPKDLNENLKRIEKLAKHLRSEITPAGPF
jgi:hypothetical protein